MPHGRRLAGLGQCESCNYHWAGFGLLASSLLLSIWPLLALDDYFDRVADGVDGAARPGDYLAVSDLSGFYILQRNPLAFAIANPDHASPRVFCVSALWEPHAAFRRCNFRLNTISKRIFEGRRHFITLEG